MGGRWGVKRWEAGRMEGGRASTVLPQGELCLLRYTRRRPSPPLRGTMGCRYLNQKSELTGRLFPCRPRNESGRHRRPTARPAALRRRCRLRRRSARRPGEARARGEGRSPTSPPSLPRRAHGPGSRAGGGRRDPRPAGAAPGPLVAAPGRPRAPGEPTGRRGVRGRGAEEEEEEGLCRRVGAPAAPQWHRRPPCRWAESLGGGRRRRQGRPGAGREPSGAGEAWRGGAGRRRRRGAGVDPAAGPGHGGGAGGRPRRPGGERHVGGVRPAVGRRDGHPGEWGRGGIGLGGSLPWDGAGRGAPLPSTAPPAPPPGGGRRSPGRAGGSPRHLLRRLPQRASVPAVRARTSQREWFRGRNPVSYRISATAFVWASAESFVGCQCRRDASPARSPAGEPGLGSGLLTGPARSGADPASVYTPRSACSGWSMGALFPVAPARWQMQLHSGERLVSCCLCIPRTCFRRPGARRGWSPVSPGAGPPGPQRCPVAGRGALIPDGFLEASCSVTARGVSALVIFWGGTNPRNSLVTNKRDGPSNKGSRNCI